MRGVFLPMRSSGGDPACEVWAGALRCMKAWWPASKRGGALAAQVRVGLEASDAGTYQRQVGYMRLLGELYAYKIVDSRYALQASAFLRSGAHLSMLEMKAALNSQSNSFWCCPQDSL